MALAPLEVLIYALVIVGKPVPTECTLKPDESVLCSNGMKAVEAPSNAAGRGMVFNEKVLVQSGMDGSLLFSNGIKAHMGSAGWITFTSGISARRDPRGSGGFVVSPDLYCYVVDTGKAACIRR